MNDPDKQGIWRGSRQPRFSRFFTLKGLSYEFTPAHRANRDKPRQIFEKNVGIRLARVDLPYCPFA
jgi:hypothetical protein